MEYLSVDDIYVGSLSVDDLPVDGLPVDDLSVDDLSVRRTRYAKLSEAYKGIADARHNHSGKTTFWPKTKSFEA